MDGKSIESREKSESEEEELDKILQVAGDISTLELLRKAKEAANIQTAEVGANVATTVVATKRKQTP